MDRRNLPGFRHADPVRIGNEASKQRQIDVLGELLDCMTLARRAGVPPSAQEALVAKAIVEHIEALWRQPGSGIWEVRGDLRHYTYSKVMAWAGVDRYPPALPHDGRGGRQHRIPPRRAARRNP